MGGDTMKGKHKGLKALLGLVLLMSLVIAGCSNGGSSGSPSPSGQQSQKGENISVPGEIDWKTVKADIRFVWPGTSEIEKEMAEQFKAKMKEKYPGVNIEFMYLSWSDMEKKLAVMINTGDAPDLTQTQDVTNLVQMNGLEDLSSYLEKEGGPLTKDSFLPGTLEYSMIDGKVYSIPQLGQAFTLIVNEQMLNDAGMKLEDLQTWADIEKAAKLMTKDGKYGFGYPLGVARFAFRVPFTVAYSNNLYLDNTSEASKPQYLELLQHFKNLEPYQPKAHMTWGYPEMFRAFGNGEVGMIVAGSFFSPNAYPINPDILKVSRVLAYPKGPSGTAAKAPALNVGYGIFKGSKNKEVAWRLIEEITSSEFNVSQAATIHFSAIKGANMAGAEQTIEKVYPKAVEDHKRITQEFFDVVSKSGEQAVKIKGQPEMETIFQTEIVKYLTDKSSLEETYQAIKTGIDGVKAKYQ
jgi:ABC-type glycerol-3-phosphate transport system substrate-binding protein